MRWDRGGFGMKVGRFRDGVVMLVVRHGGCCVCAEKVR